VPVGFPVTPEGRCPGHPHICRRAQFHQTRTCRRTPSWMFEFRMKRRPILFWTIPRTGNPIFCIHTKFGKDTMIGGRDMPPKLNSKHDGRILIPLLISTRGFLCDLRVA